MRKSTPTGYDINVPETFRALLGVLKLRGLKSTAIAEKSKISLSNINNALHLSKERTEKAGTLKYRRDGTSRDIDKLVAAYPELLEEMPLMSEEETKQLRDKTDLIENKLDNLVTRQEWLELKQDIKEIKEMLLKK